MFLWQFLLWRLLKSCRLIFRSNRHKKSLYLVRMSLDTRAEITPDGMSTAEEKQIEKRKMIDRKDYREETVENIWGKRKLRGGQERAN